MKEIISKFLLQRKRKNEETKRRIAEDKAKAFVYVSKMLSMCIYTQRASIAHLRWRVMPAR